MPIAEAWEIRVERETEWDDLQRHRMQALVLYEAGICRCGWHVSIANDTANVFAPTDDVCPVCWGYDIVTRVQHDREQSARDSAKQDPGQPLPADGRTTRMRLMDPAEAQAYRHQREEVARGRST